MSAVQESVGGLRRRAEERRSRRLEIRFGPEAFDARGYSRNVSGHGMFLAAPKVYTPGTLLKIRVETLAGSFERWARVTWARRMPPEFAHTKPTGMGLRVFDGGPAWAAACGSAKVQNGVGA
jgi:hypothetical protein